MTRHEGQSPSLPRREIVAQPRRSANAGKVPMTRSEAPSRESKATRDAPPAEQAPPVAASPPQPASREFAWQLTESLVAQPGETISKHRDSSYRSAGQPTSPLSLRERAGVRVKRPLQTIARLPRHPSPHQTRRPHPARHSRESGNPGSGPQPSITETS